MRRQAGSTNRIRAVVLSVLCVSVVAFLVVVFASSRASSAGVIDVVRIADTPPTMPGNPSDYATNVTQDIDGNFKVVLFAVEAGATTPAQLSWADFGRLLQSDGRLRALMTKLLQDSPFEAFFWETRPLTGSTAASTPFEFMIVKSPTLARVAANGRPFQDFIGPKKGTEAVEVFANLSGDALLVVPAQSNAVAASSYAHIANFVRSAPEEQVDLLWTQVSRALEQRIAERGMEAPLWVSTSGLGVYWLHVRIDNRPKYYQHDPYRHM